MIIVRALHTLTTQLRRTIEYKLILAALIDSEQMLLSIEAQLCTRRDSRVQNISTTKANACFQGKSRRLASGYLRDYISRTTSHTHFVQCS